MNKVSKKYYKLIDDYLLNDNDRISDFLSYPCNFGYNDLQNECWMPQKKFEPYEELVEENKELNTINFTDSRDDIEIEEENANPALATYDQELLKQIKDTPKAKDIYMTDRFNQAGIYAPLTMLDLKYIQRGLWCYLSDPFDFTRCYGRVWLYLHFSDKMPKIKGLKHTINYYKQHIKSPKQAKKYFHIKIADHFHAKVASDGTGEDTWYDDLKGDAGKMDKAFIKSKFGQKLNEANH